MKKPTDSLSRQLVSDALVRKGLVKDANAEYIQNLRISDTAIDQDIQDAVYKLLKSNPQGRQGPQGHSIISDIIPHGTKQDLQW